MRCRSNIPTRTRLGVWHGNVLALPGVCAWLVFWCAGSIASGQEIPRPTQYVVDRVGVIDSQTRHQLNGYLQELEQKTTAQVVVMMVDTTAGLPIEQYALNLAERWKLGQKGKDNGVLIVVAVRDRKYRIEVGYGLEGPLPDSWVGTLGREAFQPSFKAGNYSRGIEQAALAIATRIAGHYSVTVTGMPQVTFRQGRPGRRFFGGCFSSLLPIVIIFLMIGRGRRRGRGFWVWPLLMGGYMGGGRQHGGSSGWGGGGFGGFGGGGGGSFGGGGASGSW